MPELPEVETLARDLRGLILGAEISRVKIGWSGSVAMPSVRRFVAGLKGRRFLAVSRRGKFLQLDLTGPSYLLVHLRMTGHLAVVPASSDPVPYTRVSFDLSDGRRLAFSDPRKFGRMWWLDQPDLVLGKLGPDPIADDLTCETFVSLIQAHRGAIKPLLLRQDILAGLGNIYTDEALFRAGIHPLRRVDTLSQADLERLYAAVREVLEQAIANRGTTLPDERFRDAQGNRGGNLEHLLVGRSKGQVCPRCGAVLQRAVVGGRGTYSCPTCQKQDQAVPEPGENE
jgi:formamidopyrimidine-DNA glycosylase